MGRWALVVINLQDGCVLSLRELAGIVQEDDCEFSSSFRCRRLERGDVYFVSIAASQNKDERQQNCNEGLHKILLRVGCEMPGLVLTVAAKRSAFQYDKARAP